MPTYTIEGKRVKTDAPLTDDEIDEIAASIRGETAPATTQKATTTTTEQPTDTITSSFLMGLKDPISAGAQMLPRGLEYLTSIGGIAPNALSKFFGSEAQRVDQMVKAEEQAYQAGRESSGETGMDWGRVAGNVINPVNIAAGAGVTRALGAARPITQAMGVGAATGLLQPVTGGDFQEEKLKQAASGAIGGALGRGATVAAGKVLNPIASKAEQTMRELGVTLTPGQMLGKQPKALEEFAQNLPLVGQYISNAKERQLFKFNQGVINRALGKIGQKLPEDVIGRDAVAAANKMISDQYDDVLSKINFRLDKKIQSEFGKVVRTSKLTSGQEKQKLNDLINNYIYSKIPVNNKGVGTIDGQAFKGIESDILKKVQSLKSSSTDAERSLGMELGRALDVFKSAMRSQNQQQSSILRRIDSAYGDIAVMRTAAANSGAVNGVFTPKHYQTAVRQRDTSRSKSAFAAGTARGQDVSEAAMELLNPEVGSTVEGRIAMSMGGLYGALQNPAMAAGATIAAPAMYSEAGLRAMQTIMRSRPEIAKKIGETLVKRATKEGSITGAQIVAEYNRLTKTKPESKSVEELKKEKLPVSSPPAANYSKESNLRNIAGAQGGYANQGNIGQLNIDVLKKMDNPEAQAILKQLGY